MDASANELGVSVVTQRGAVIGLELLFSDPNDLDQPTKEQQ